MSTTISTIIHARLDLSTIMHLLSAFLGGVTPGELAGKPGVHTGFFSDLLVLLVRKIDALLVIW